MKTFIVIIALTTIFSLTSIAARPRVVLLNADGQLSIEETISNADDTAEQTADKVKEEAKKEQADAVQSEIEKQLAETQSQVAQAQTLANAAAAAAADSDAVAIASDLPGLQNRLQSVIKRSGHSGKPLVIRSSEPDAKEQNNIEEDMAVMSHILDKALEEKVSSTPRAHKAMGINVYFSSSSPMRNLYLDGYGAVFMLRVGFPLVAPPKAEAKKEKTETSSTWEEARQELYGQTGGTKTLVGPAEDYDEDKVNELKDSILEALKNAANIRDLKPDESVTICVFGSAGTVKTQARSGVKRGATPGVNVDNHVWVINDHGAGSARGTILTIRVKKSDADAFAKGKLTLDDFRKKAKMAAYTGNSDGGSMSGIGSGSGFSYDFGSWSQNR